MTRFSSVLLATSLAFAAPAASATVRATPLAPEQATRELRILKRALTDLHAGLYRYQTPQQVDAAFASAAAEVADGSDSMEMYLLATRLAAAVRCGHTWTNPVNQSDALQSTLARLPALPVRIRILEGRWLVTASTDPAIRTGDEILAVDGLDATELTDEFMPYLRADGGSDGKRLSQLDSTVDGGALDRLLPLLHAPRAGRYALRLRDGNGNERSVDVAAVSARERERHLLSAGLPGDSEDWRLAIEGGVATLTLPTFAFWKSDFNWRAFLDNAFATLHQRGIRSLIIDLRQNEGGDQEIGEALLSRLIASPHRVPAPRVESAYERVPYDLARYLDTWDFSFFDRTGQVVRGDGRNWTLVAQPAEKVIAPATDRYAGRVAMLIGPRMSSAGFLLARNVKASGAATLIGQPTGGNLRGLNGGEIAWLTLPYSGVAIDIPLLASFTPGDPPDSGVAPHRIVRTRIDDARRGIDPDRNAALRWLVAPDAITAGSSVSTDR